MLLGPERRARIRQRLAPILSEYDPELQFLTVFLDSTREYLGAVVQRGEDPLILKFQWVAFISSPDSALRDEVFSQLDRRLHRK